jgi:hypothetical protein
MPVVYSDAPELAELAQPLIDSIHTDLSDVPIRFIFRSEAAVNKGKSVWAKARLVSGLNAHLAGPIIAGGKVWDRLFVIEVALDVWEGLSERSRSALLDHELSHCRAEGDSLFIAAHTVEEFSGVIRRWGLWRQSLEDIAEPMRLALDRQD